MVCELDVHECVNKHSHFTDVMASSFLSHPCCCLECSAIMQRWPWANIAREFPESICHDACRLFKQRHASESSAMSPIGAHSSSSTALAKTGADSSSFFTVCGDGQPARCSPPAAFTSGGKTQPYASFRESGSCRRRKWSKGRDFSGKGDKDKFDEEDGQFDPDINGDLDSDYDLVVSDDEVPFNVDEFTKGEDCEDLKESDIDKENYEIMELCFKRKDGDIMLYRKYHKKKSGDDPVGMSRAASNVGCCPALTLKLSGNCSNNNVSLP